MFGGGELLFALLIFLLEIVYVTIMTTRWIILVKGYKLIASFIALFEQLLYLTALSLVVSKLSDFSRLIAYAAGYALGTLLGSWLENRLAIGYVAYHVVTKVSGLSPILRDEGVGVTSWTGEGRDGIQEILFVVVRRKKINMMLVMLNQLDPNAFITRTELQSLNGGYLFR
jgi:uncharacterized protein YebE (UPF0316 family)